MQAGGSRHQVRRIVYAGQAALYRAYANAPMVGACYQRERAILRQIQSFAWAPEVLAEQPDGLVFRYYPQPVCLPLTPSSATALLGCVAQWQHITAGPRYDYAALWACYQQAVQRSGWGEALLDQLLTHFAQLPVLPACLTHHDLHPGNLRADGNGQLIVLDWEYAGLGCAWLDLAALQQGFGCSAEMLVRLPILSGLSATERSQGLRDAQIVKQALDQLWWRLFQPAA